MNELGERSPPHFKWAAVSAVYRPAGRELTRDEQAGPVEKILSYIYNQ